MRAKITKLRRLELHKSKVIAAIAILLVASVGIYLLAGSHAAGSYASAYASNGTLTNGATVVSDSSAAHGTAVAFGGVISGTANCPGLTNAAFCDNFNTATINTTGSRSGQLNGTVWGVSRGTNNANLGGDLADNWAGVTLSSPCGTQVVLPPRDVQICNGQLIEAVNDNENQTVLAMYPRQPFDISGRTGKVVFDVSDNTQGTHASWPEFAFTDQPVPAPRPNDGSVPGIEDNPRNSFGIAFGSAQNSSGLPPSGNEPGICIGVDNFWSTVNYQASQLTFNQDGCVKASTAVGQNNHVEIDISSTNVKVYATDAGTTGPLKLIADANLTMPLTRGLVWMEDVHYNANKFNTQQSNTFSWDNFGFDGPVLPRDLGFDVPDNTTPDQSALNGNPTVDIGYRVPSGSGQSLTVTIPNVHNVANAAAALLEFTPSGGVYGPDTFTYAINNGPSHDYTWPYEIGSAATGAIPVPVTDLADGTVTIHISATTDVFISNIDLILVGAGGTPNPNMPID